MTTNHSACAIAITTIGVIIAGPAQALTLYEDNTTKFELYGRVHVIMEHGDDGTDFEDQASRLGFRASKQITPGLAAFVRGELRFNGDETTTEVTSRNSYVGIRGTFGSLYAGNFDSIYNDNVSDVLNVDENRGFRSFNKGGERARGDSIAFESTKFGGMRLGISTKFQAEDAEEDQEEATTSQAYISYEVDRLGLAIGYDQANEDFDDGAEDSLLGLAAIYEIMPGFEVGSLVEEQGDLRHYGISSSFNYGKGDIYGLVSYAKDTDADASDTQYLAGVNYKFSKPMYVYIEYADSTNPEVIGPGAIDALGTDYVTLGARYSF